MLLLLSFQCVIMDLFFWFSFLVCVGIYQKNFFTYMSGLTMCFEADNDNWLQFLRIWVLFPSISLSSLFYKVLFFSSSISLSYRNFFFLFIPIFLLSWIVASLTFLNFDYGSKTHIQSPPPLNKIINYIRNSNLWCNYAQVCNQSPSSQPTRYIQSGSTPL